MEELPAHILSLASKILIIGEDGIEREILGNPKFGGESIYRVHSSLFSRIIPEKFCSENSHSLLSPDKIIEKGLFLYIDKNGIKQYSSSPFGPWGEDVEVINFLSNVNIITKLSRIKRLTDDFKDYYPHYIEIFGNESVVHIRAKEVGKDFVEFIYKL